MRWLTDLRFRLRALFGRDAMDRELDEEIAFHIDMEARKLEADGLSPKEALRRARVAFGGEERFKERARDAWGVGLLNDLRGDVRFATRQLVEHPAFSALAALTLALGIGGTVALFSVVNGLMLRPLPVADEDRVVTFWHAYDWRGVEFDFAKERVGAFQSLAAYSSDALTLRTDAGSSLILSTVSSAELFDVVGVPAFLGRTFLEGEDRLGAEPVMVLSHELWVSDFGADPDVVGRMVDIGGRRTRVVGVMPAGFYFPTPEADVWTPLMLDPESDHYHGNGWLVLTGRLRDGVTEAQVREDLAQLAVGLGERWDYPDAWDKTRDPYVVPLREYVMGDVRPALLLLLGAVGVVLLMACANVAALILTRTADRTGEMSVRTALGAGRARLARQVLTESILLGSVSGAMGIVLAVAAFDTLVAGLPLPASLGETLHLDWTLLAGGVVLAVLTGALVSLAPMRSLLRGDLSQGVLGARSSAGGPSARNRMQAALVAAEVLMAVVLVTGAALLVRTVSELRSIDWGLEPEGVLAVDVLHPEQATTAAERARFYEALLERVGALPGVSAAGLINRVPVRDGGWQAGFSLVDRPDLTGDRRPNMYYRPVTPGTFDALGVAVVEGRGIRETDTPDAPRVTVVNETFGRTMFPDGSSVGRIIDGNGFTDEPIEIVGVVANVAVDDLTGNVPMAAYYPWAQTLEGSDFGILIAKTSLDPSTLAGPVRSLVRELDARAAVGRVETMEQVVDVAMAEPLRLRFFLAMFSVLGIVLGTVGVYGVVSYAVQRRRAELGIRLALGAAPGRLLGEVVRGGMVPVLIGVAAGVVVARVTSATLARFLFEVRPTDPLSLLAAAGALLVAGALGALLPAWRASTTHPATALRAE